MPLGIVVLLISAALIFLGFLHRVLDRMRLTDGQALLILVLMVAGSFVDLTLRRALPSVSVNLGGAVVPLAVAVWLVVTAGDEAERLRGVLAPVLTAAAIVLVSRAVDFGPEGPAFIDPLWLFSAVAGVVGYLAGRSRRAAFIAGTAGVVLADLWHLLTVIRTGAPATVSLGGAGVFDATVIGGVVAVGLAELVGEARERLAGGGSGSQGGTGE